jgi:hypothetical protein
MEMKMGKELNVVTEVITEAVETQIGNQIIKLDELTLAYIGGGDAIVAL